MNLELLKKHKVLVLVIAAFCLIIGLCKLMEHLAESSRDSKRQAEQTESVKPAPKANPTAKSNNSVKHDGPKEYSFGEYVVAIATFDKEVIKTLTFWDVVLGLIAIAVIVDVVKSIIFAGLGKDD